MVYSNFTLETVRKEFQLETVQSIGIFGNVQPVSPREHFTSDLAKKVSVASAVNTEKARSELIVVDVLFELLEHFNQRISLFSGIEFNVDVEEGLTGVCDFLISKSPDQLSLEAPIIILVEAKKEDLTAGLEQCVAEMIAAQRYNAEKGNDIPRIYGTTTSGTDWRFLKLEELTLHIDTAPYQIVQCDKILGILVSMVKQQV